MNRTYIQKIQPIGFVPPYWHLEDGSVVDNLDPDKEDMSWPDLMSYIEGWVGDTIDCVYWDLDEAGLGTPDSVYSFICDSFYDVFSRSPTDKERQKIKEVCKSRI